MAVNRLIVVAWCAVTRGVWRCDRHSIPLVLRVQKVLSCGGTSENGNGADAREDDEGGRQ